MIIVLNTEMPQGVLLMVHALVAAIELAGIPIVNLKI